MVAMAAMLATESTVAVLVAMMPMALPRADVPSVMETALRVHYGGEDNGPHVFGGETELDPQRS